MAMIELSPQITPKDTQPPPEWPEPAGTPFAVRAACVVLAILSLALAYMVHRLNAVVTHDKAQLAQAAAEADQLKSDLGKANARASDLQLQSDRAKGLAADLQAQLGKAKARQAEAQAQLEGARADLRAQADKARAQASEMQAEFQAKVRASDDALSGLRRELDQARSQAEGLQAQLARAKGELTKLQPLARVARALPVATSFEKNFWDRGFTLHVKNLSPDPLKVTITVATPGRPLAKSVTMDGGATVNIENLAAGAKVVLEGADYDALSVTAQ